MRIEISKLHHRLETTMIYVTHDQVEAMTMGDKIVVLKDGEIQQVDSPLNLYNNPVNTFVAGFIGSPSMNFFKGALVKSDTLNFVTSGLQITLNDIQRSKLEKLNTSKEIILGIRPEHIFTNGDHGSGNAVSAEIEVLEPMGIETVAYLKSGQTTFTIRDRQNKNYKPGQKIDIQFNLNKIHLFDPISESVI